MTAVKANDVDALIRRGPDPRIVCLLVYGPDTGLVSERATALVKRFVDDPDDPFSLIRLDGDALASDPGRLLDEAGTVSLLGGARTVRVRAGSRNFGPAVEALLAGDVGEARVVIEAGDLGKSAPLRTACERSQKALALPCYPDDARSLAELIERTLGDHGLTIERDARDLLASSLGGDRRASLAEIEKLALYARGQGSVGLDDVEAVASDVAPSVLNTPIDAAFAGRGSEVEREVRRLRHEGLDPSAILGAALRHALQMLALRLDNPGAPPGTLASNWRGLHFRRKGSVEAQFGRWPEVALQGAVARLQEAVLACRRAGPDLSEALLSAALLGIAQEARRRR